MTLRRILQQEYGNDGMLDLDFERGAAQLVDYRASDDARARVRVIAGHFEEGVVADFGATARYFTMLREPVQRVVSNYNYWRQHERGREQLQGVSLRDFVTSDETGPRVNNLMTRLVGDALVGQVRPPSADTLAKAKMRLADEFSVFGLTERFDESVMLMHHVLGWAHWPFYERRNATPADERTPPVPRDVLDLIAEHNELDAELYRYAATRFQASVRDGGERFRLEVALFRTLNSPSGRRLRSSASRQRAWAVRLPRRVGRAFLGRRTSSTRTTR